jgi:NADH-quinone oxidoreductase subunit K
MHLVYPVALGALLFSVGIYGVLARRNAVLILMSIEIMLNAVNINLIAFDAWLRDPLMGGQIFALFVITVAAAEVGVGLAIVLLIFRNRETVDLDHLRELSDTQPARTPRAAPEEASVR